MSAEYTHDQPPHIPDADVLQEMVAKSASDLATVLSVASDETRSGLIQAVAGELEPVGATIVDLHGVLKNGTLSTFNPDSLEGKTGAQSGMTRAQILAAREVLRATMRPRGPHRRRV